MAVKSLDGDVLALARKWVAAYERLTLTEIRSIPTEDELLVMNLALRLTAIRGPVAKRYLTFRSEHKSGDAWEMMRATTHGCIEIALQEPTERNRGIAQAWICLLKARGSWTRTSASPW